MGAAHHELVALARTNHVEGVARLFAAEDLLAPTIDVGYAFARKVRAPANPCGAGAATHEWSLPSPPSFHPYEAPAPASNEGRSKLRPR